jgi:hypothetical protein
MMMRMLLAVPSWLSDVPAVVQTAFWAVVGTVTILAFLQARRTVLQPLRTEVFKLQLNEMSRLLDLFVHRGEVDLRKYMGYDELVAANVMMLLDAYAYGHLGYKHPEDYTPPYRDRERFPMAYVEPESLTLAVDHLRPADRQERTTEGKARLSWSEYRHVELGAAPLKGRRRAGRT